MKTLTIELEPCELRIIQRRAAKRLREPDNYARYLLLRAMGLLTNDDDDDDDEPMEKERPPQWAA